MQFEKNVKNVAICISTAYLLACAPEKPPEEPATSEISPPVAPIKESVREFHGYELRDPYAWMRPENWAEALLDTSKLPVEIKAHMELENNYSEAVLAPIREEQAQLRTEMAANFAHMGNSSLLLPEDGYYYYQRADADGNPIYLRSKSKPDLDGEMAPDEEVLLDTANAFADSDFFKVSTAEQSQDHRYFAYAVDFVGSETFSICLQDLSTGKSHGVVAANTSGELVWSGGDNFYFVRKDDAQRPKWVYRYNLNTASEELVYESQDPGLVMTVDKTRTGRYMRINFWNEETSEVLLIDSMDESQNIVTTLGRQQHRQYGIDENGQRFFVRDSQGDSPESTIYSTPLNDLSQRSILVPERAGVNLLDMRVFKNHLAWIAIENARVNIFTMDLVTGEQQQVPFTEASYMATFLPDQDFNGSLLRLNYRSPTTPGQVIEFDMASGEIHNIIGEPAVKRDGYVLSLSNIDTRDNRQLPLTLFYKKDTVLDGSAPALLIGYGGHGAPSHFMLIFQPLYRALADRGWITGLVHVRGSSDKGRQWSLDGKKLNKINGFNDLIDASEYLIEAKYSRKKRISIYGGSAGGYLVGATTNMRPDLYAATIAAVPFVDVLNSELDIELPPTYRSWAEWGNPLHNKADFENLLKISPYDNVKSQAYPYMFLTGGLADFRVPFWEPAKFAARIRAHNTGDSKILLKMAGAGHSAVSSGGMLDDMAEKAAFLLWVDRQINDG